MTKSKLLTKKQVAQLFNISERTLDRWRKRGEINSIKLGSVVRFNRQAVQAALLKMSKEG
jgi:excisionase family DNA binding protein